MPKFFFHQIENNNWDLTLIPYPGAIFVRKILFSSLRVEISVRKIWENLTFIFSLFRLFFCEKNIAKFLEI